MNRPKPKRPRQRYKRISLTLGHILPSKAAVLDSSTLRPFPPHRNSRVSIPGSRRVALPSPPRIALPSPPAALCSSQSRTLGRHPSLPSAHPARRPSLQLRRITSVALCVWVSRGSASPTTKMAPFALLSPLQLNSVPDMAVCAWIPLAVLLNSVLSARMGCSTSCCHI